MRGEQAVTQITVVVCHQAQTAPLHVEWEDLQIRTSTAKPMPVVTSSPATSPPARSRPGNQVGNQASGQRQVDQAWHLAGRR
jgi:hypothetical protein